MDYLEASAEALVCCDSKTIREERYLDILKRLEALEDHNDFVESHRIKVLEERIRRLEATPDWSEIIKEAVKNIPKQPSYVPYYPYNPGIPATEYPWRVTFTTAKPRYSEWSYNPGVVR